MNYFEKNQKKTIQHYQADFIVNKDSVNYLKQS